MPCGPAAVLLTGARLLVAGTLLRAAAGKLRGSEDTVAVIRAAVPSGWARHAAGLAWVVVALEMLLGVALAVGAAPSAAALGVVLMMSLFALVLARLRSKGWTAECACFGTPGVNQGGMPVTRNVLIAVFAFPTALGLDAPVSGCMSTRLWDGDPRIVAAGAVMALITWQGWELIDLVRRLHGETRISHDR